MFITNINFQNQIGNIPKFILPISFFVLAGIPNHINSFEIKRLGSSKFSENNTLIAKKSNVRTVVTIGYGKTVDEAAQNSAENALKQVVGSFIDSETLLKKEKEISNGKCRL